MRAIGIDGYLAITGMKRATFDAWQTRGEIALAFGLARRLAGGAMLDLDCVCHFIGEALAPVFTRKHAATHRRAPTATKSSKPSAWRTPRPAEDMFLAAVEFGPGYAITREHRMVFGATTLADLAASYAKQRAAKASHAHHADQRDAELCATCGRAPPEPASIWTAPFFPPPDDPMAAKLIATAKKEREAALQMYARGATAVAARRCNDANRRHPEPQSDASRVVSGHGRRAAASRRHVRSDRRRHPGRNGRRRAGLRARGAAPSASSADDLVDVFSRKCCARLRHRAAVAAMKLTRRIAAAARAFTRGFDASASPRWPAWASQVAPARQALGRAPCARLARAISGRQLADRRGHRRKVADQFDRRRPGGALGPSRRGGARGAGGCLGRLLRARRYRGRRRPDRRAQCAPCAGW